jgi:hypothetical protein
MFVKYGALGSFFVKSCVLLNLHCLFIPSLLLCHRSIRTVGAGVTRRVELMDGGQDVHHKQAAAWLQDNSNPHEKGFDVTGKRRINPHAFRVDKELFTNSIAWGMKCEMIKHTDYKKYCPFSVAIGWFSMDDWPVLGNDERQQDGKAAGYWRGGKS